ncbi:MAG: MFS transporter [Microthrixaceae bacterium]
MTDPHARATLAATVTGVALVPLNSTMIAVALPDVSKDLGVSAGRTGILVLAYLMAMALLQPLSGRVSDRVGHRRLALGALAGFGLSSAAAGLAPTFAALVIFRSAQAVFGAALVPALQALLRATTDDATRGRAFGLMGTGIGAGAALGPLVGGLAVSAGGWRAIFALNVPIVAAAIALLARLAEPSVPEPAASHERAVPGSSPQGSLRSPVFIATCVIQAAGNLGQYALLLVVPLILDGRGWDHRSTGFALSGLTVGLVLLSPVGGRVGDRVGRRAPAAIGLAILTAGLVLSTVVAQRASSAPLIGAMALVGIGMGLSSASVQTAGLEAVRVAVTGTAAGLLSTSRYLGSISCSAVLALTVSDGGGGSRPLLALGAAAGLVALLASSQLPGRPHSSAGAPRLDPLVAAPLGQD